MGKVIVSLCKELTFCITPFKLQTQTEHDIRALRQLPKQQHNTVVPTLQSNTQPIT